MQEAPGDTTPTHSPTDLWFYLVTVAAGLCVGAVGTFFHLAADAALSVHSRIANEFLLVPAMVLSAAASVAMVLVALMLVRRFAPETAGSGVQEIEGAMIGLRPLRWRRVLPVKYFAGVLSIGSGLVLGREGPTIHIGASICAAFAENGRFARTETRGLYAAGAAAGLAAAFNAPLAAVLFVVEETRKQFPYTFRTYMGVIIAAFLSTVVTQEIAGVGADLRIAAPHPPVWQLLLFLGLGAVLGGFGVLFNRVLLWSLDVFATIEARLPFVLPLIVAAAIGALLVAMPEVTQGGESLILQLVAEHRSVAGLLFLVALRFLTTMASYPTGVPGGIFAPILTMATCVGLAIAALLNAILPGAGVASDAFVIAAMGGLFAATVRAPLVGIVLVAELTGSYTVLLPTIATCAVASVVAQKLGGRPIYEQLLDRTLRRAGIAVPAESEALPVELGFSDERAADEPPGSR